MRNYRFLAALTLVAGAAATAASCSGCRGNGTASGENGGDPASVSIEVARVQSLRATVAGPGLTAPSSLGDWTITAAETGRIVSIAKREGDAVESGEVLIRFEYATVSGDASAREAELSGATARLASAKAALAKITPLFQGGYASKNEFESAKSAVESADADVARFKRLAEIASNDTDRSVIRARFPGIVTKLYHNEGDLVNGSMLDPVMRVIDPAKVEVVMNVQIQDLAQIQVTQPAMIISANGAEPGTVAQRPAPTDPRATSQDIRIAFTNPTTLPVDTTVSVEIVLAERADVIALPVAAVIRDGADKAYVMIANADGRAHRRDVTTGLTARDRVEIMSGVASGDRVIVKDAANVAEGAPVVADQ